MAVQAKHDVHVIIPRAVLAIINSAVIPLRVTLMAFITFMVSPVSAKEICLVNTIAQISLRSFSSRMPVTAASRKNYELGIHSFDETN